jgi:hypothetical protein
MMIVVLTKDNDIIIVQTDICNGDESGCDHDCIDNNMEKGFIILPICPT